MKLRSGKVKNNERMDNTKESIGENENKGEVKLKNENKGTRLNNRKEIGSLETRHKGTNTGTIPKATKRSIDIIWKPCDRDRQRKGTLHKHNEKT